MSNSGFPRSRCLEPGPPCNYQDLFLPSCPCKVQFARPVSEVHPGVREIREKWSCRPPSELSLVARGGGSPSSCEGLLADRPRDPGPRARWLRSAPRGGGRGGAVSPSPGRCGGGGDERGRPRPRPPCSAPRWLGRGGARPSPGPGEALGEFAVVTSHVLQLPDTSAFLSDKLKRLKRLEPAAASTHGHHVRPWHCRVLTRAAGDTGTAVFGRGRKPVCAAGPGGERAARTLLWLP